MSFAENERSQGSLLLNHESFSIVSNGKVCSLGSSLLTTIIAVYEALVNSKFVTEFFGTNLRVNYRNVS